MRRRFAPVRIKVLHRFVLFVAARHRYLIILNKYAFAGVSVGGGRSCKPNSAPGIIRRNVVGVQNGPVRSVRGYIIEREHEISSRNETV